MISLECSLAARKSIGLEGGFNCSIIPKQRVRERSATVTYEIRQEILWISMDHTLDRTDLASTREIQERYFW